MNLSELFMESKGQPVEVEGRSVHAIYRRAVQPQEQLQLTIVHFCVLPVQGIRLKLLTGSLQVDGGQLLGDVVLWTDVAPRVILFRCISKKATELRIWNCWRDERSVMQAWIGNAAIEIDNKAGEPCRLRCNSRNELTFNDLVLDVQSL